jgi:hypothetical protein
LLLRAGKALSLDVLPAMWMASLDQVIEHREMMDELLSASTALPSSKNRYGVRRIDSDAKTVAAADSNKIGRAKNVLA